MASSPKPYIAALLAIVLSAVVPSPAAGQAEDQEAPLDASSKAVLEASRLIEEAMRLHNDGKLKQALSFAERHRAEIEAGFGPATSHAPGLSDTIFGLLYFSNGLFPSCISHADAAVPPLEKSVGPDHERVADALKIGGLCRLALGDYGRAEPLFRRALAIYEKTPETKFESIIEMLRDLGSVEEKKGDLESALAMYRRARESLEARGKDSTQLAAILNDIAEVYQWRGDFHLAEPLLEKALHILETLVPESRMHGDMLDNMGSFYLDKGDPARAEPLFKKALEIHEKDSASLKPGLVGPLNHLARVAMLKRDFAAAEKAATRGVAIAEEVFGRDHRGVIASLTTLGVVLAMKEELDGARKVLESALEISVRLLGPENHETVPLYEFIAEIDRWSGNPTAASRGYRRALKSYERELGAEHPTVAEPLFGITKAELAQGNTGEALAALERGIRVREKLTALALTTGSEEQRQAFVDWQRGELFLAISIQSARGPGDARATEVALTTLLQRKARALDAMADTMAAWRRGLRGADRPVFDELAKVQTKLSTLAAQKPDGAAAGAHRETIQKLDAERQALVSKLSVPASDIGGLAVGVTIDAVRAALPEGAVLVEIAAYMPFNPKSRRFTEDYGAARYAAYALPKSGAVQWADLGDAAAIDKAATVLINALSETSVDPKRPARELYDRVIKPMRAMLGNAKQIFISPDGALNLIPFGALMDEEGNYLLDRFSFTYLTSGRDLVRRRAVEGTRSRDVIVVASPDFGPIGAAGASSGGASTSRGRRSADMAKIAFKPLKSTEAEGRALKERMPGARLLLGKEATEGAVKAARKPAILHLATHGFYLPDKNAGATGTLAATKWERAIRSHGENPLLRAGLALEGANARSSGNEDGILTALEVSGLDLLGTQLVVLSACETGVGEAPGGAGVYGLRRALALAGSETQVLSLWEVDDQATSALMSAYYERLLKGEGRVEAMHEVQRGMKENKLLSHPHYWASFIVFGSGAPLDGRSEIGVPRVPPGASCGCSLPGTEMPGQVWAMAALIFAAGGRARRRLRGRAEIV